MPLTRTNVSCFGRFSRIFFVECSRMTAHEHEYTNHRDDAVRANDWTTDDADDEQPLLGVNRPCFFATMRSRRGDASVQIYNGHRQLSTSNPSFVIASWLPDHWK